MNITKEVLSAEQRIRAYTLTTPLLESKELSKRVGGKVYLKLENEQHTGSFKARGSLNKILSLSPLEKAKGIVTASTGNHALGVARALEITGTQGTIFLPEHASKAKVAALSHYTAELQFYGRDSLQTELHAKKTAKEKGCVWVSPYDDPKIMGGQGTIAVELCQQLAAFDAILVTMGGGGLISGIGSYLNTERPSTKIIGCQPANSPEMTLSLKKGEIVALEAYVDTLSDGSAGGIEPDAMTFPICQQVVDDCLLVSEKEIKTALRLVVHHHKKIIEGAAAVTVAALLKHKAQFKNKTVVLVICGGNIDIEKLKQII